MFRVREPRVIDLYKEKLPHEFEWRSLHGIADQAKPEMVDAFLKAVARTQGEIVLRNVEKAIAMGNINAAVELIPWDNFSVELNQLAVVFKQIFDRAGKKSIEFLPKKIEHQASFNTLNPKSLDYIKDHTGKLIVEITEESRKAVRAVINRAFVEGMHPYESAKYIRQIVGLTERQGLAVDNLRKLLIKQGASANVIEKQLKLYTKRLLVYRSKNIARTETINAANQGQQSLWIQSADKGLISRVTAKRRWITTRDDRLCQWCKSLNGQLVGLEEEFGTALIGGRSYTSLTPTLHPSCRCSLGLVLE
jgi:hypothetical protein